MSDFRPALGRWETCHKDRKGSGMMPVLLAIMGALSAFFSVILLLQSSNVFAVVAFACSGILLGMASVVRSVRIMEAHVIFMAKQQAFDADNRYPEE
jgi:hypothetical protein